MKDQNLLFLNIYKEEIHMKRLGDNISIQGMQLRNRFVMAPLTTRYATAEGLASPESLQFYSARAKDVGLVIVEAAAIHINGRIVQNSLGLWNDQQIPSMTQLTNIIKDNGAKAIIQLNHAGAKACCSEPLSPSGVMCKPGISSKVMTTEDIQNLITDFTSAALRAQKAGFDGVEIHGAHLYLLGQFLSPLTNHRTDEYGGSIKSRALLAVQVVQALRKQLGSEYPIFFRLNVIENVAGGLTADDAISIGKLLVKAGVNVLDLSLAAHVTWSDYEDTQFLTSSSAYSKNDTTGDVTKNAGKIGSECKVPVIAVGRLGSYQASDKALQEGADLIALGRQMICAPRTVETLLRKESPTVACDACMGCFASLAKGGLRCKNNRHLPQ